MTEVRWEALKAHELRALAQANAAVIVPLASIEQHGPHLPTMTDTRIGHEIAVRAARKASATRPVVVTPVVWSGLSEHHMAFGGTLTIRPETFQALVCDLVAAIARHGFRDVVLSNSHGGNQIAMQHIAGAIAMTSDTRVVAVTYINEAREEIGRLLDDQTGIQHACEGETAMMQALEPALVDSTDLGGLATPLDTPLLVAGKGSYRWRPFTAVTNNGVLGVPEKATPEKGEAILDAAATGIANLITAPETWADS